MMKCMLPTVREVWMFFSGPPSIFFSDAISKILAESSEIFKIEMSITSTINGAFCI